jgi:hypothetical protein
MLLKYIKYELERIHAGAWLGVMAVLASIMVPMTASAAQITARSATVSSSAGAASATYTIAFNLPTTGTLGSIKFQICDSPLSTTACAASASAGINSNGAAFTGSTFGSMSLGTGWTETGQTAASTSGTSAYITHTAASLSGAASVVLNTVTNPTGANQQYYLRIQSYTGTDGATGPVDFGAVALATTQSITVAANVQESLTFCVGTTVAPANCAAETGSSVNLGTGTDNVLSTAPSGGISTMMASTNATSGYSITYLAGNFSSSSDTITAINGGTGTKLAMPAAGTPAFGLNLMANTIPTITNSAAVTGAGSGAGTANYTTTNQFAFVPSSATTMASAAGPTVNNTYTVSYAAQAGSTTKPGAFSTTFNYVATGLF